MKKIPKPATGIMIYNDEGKIFLAKSHKWSNLWIVPGGHLEYGEKLFENVKREAKEETGLNVADIEFVQIQESLFSKEFYKSCHMVFFNFCCKAASKKVTLNEELDEFTWIFPEQALKKLKLNSATRQFIKKFIELGK